MSAVRDRGDARWLPSRFHFAMFRLIAYVRLRQARREDRPGLVMAVDRYQSAIEIYAVAGCVILVATSFITSLLAPWMSLGAACLVAIIATPVIIQIVFIAFALAVPSTLRRYARMSSDYNIPLTSAFLMLMVIVAAALLAAGNSPLRHVGTAFLLLVGVNAVAAVAVFILQRPIAEAERRYGVE